MGDKKIKCLIVTKISFSQKGSNNSLKRKDTKLLKDARAVEVKRRIIKEDRMHFILLLSMFHE